MTKSYSLVNIPFSWENQPGISKVMPQEVDDDDEDNNNNNNNTISFSPMQEGLYSEQDERPKLIKLPPPPCQKRLQPLPSGAIYVPLPPCAFQSMPMTIMTTKEGGGDDPFLAAYMECTKSRRRPKMDRGWSRIRRRISVGFGCGSKWACEVKEDTMIRARAGQDKY